MIDDAAVKAFKRRSEGVSSAPGDVVYESARKVYNGMVDGRPRLIARGVDVADVIAAVNFARERSLLFAVRGCGHNGVKTLDMQVIDLGPDAEMRPPSTISSPRI